MENSAMNAVILACSSMARQAAVAQKKMGTNYPMRCVDRRYHAEPKEMRLQLIQALAEIAGEFDTVLVAMGLLNTDGAPHENLKEPGHIYIRDTDTGRYSLEGLRGSVCERYGREQGLALFDKWFESYTHADIIDTGTYDSRAEDFLAQARRGAEITRCELRHVPGGNIVLEKLVSGRWDDLFVVAEAGETLTRDRFFPRTERE